MTSSDPDRPTTASLPRSVQGFVGLVIATGALLLVKYARLPDAQQVRTYFVLVVAMIIASACKVTLPTIKTKATMSLALLVDLVALLKLGAPLALVIAAIGGLVQSTVHVKHRSPPYRVLFNAATLVITMACAAFAYRTLGGSSGGPLSFHDVMPLVAAGVTYFLVNSGTMAVVIALATSQPVQRVWHHQFLWSAPIYFVGASVAGAMAASTARGLWLPLLPMLGVAYLSYRAYGVYVGRLQDEYRHREIIESLNEGMLVVDRGGQITLWNEAAERITGRSRLDVVGRPLAGVPALATTSVLEVLQTVLRNGSAQTLERVLYEEKSRRRFLRVRVFPFAAGATVFLNDITEHAEAEIALKRSEERYALAAAGANDGLWDWDLARDEVYCSPRWKAMLGLPSEASVCRSGEWFERIHADDAGSAMAALTAHLAGKTPHFEHEHQIRHEDGSYRWVLCRGIAVRDSSGTVTRLAGSQTDVTDRAIVREQLRHAALHDPLTGLPNRTCFTERLDRVLDQAHRAGRDDFAVLFLDIDRFKIVNDSLGHAAGDSLLVLVSRRLESCVRQGDLIARLGGDEFTILVPEVHEPGHAQAIATRIQEALRVAFPIQGQDLFVSASIGIALGRAEYRNAEEVMRDADTAMYRAKILGKARSETFDPAMHATAVERLRLESDLRRALERGEFTLHYQPIVSLPELAWTGFEALLRWPKDGRELLPSEFVPLAEETGLIAPLGAWVLREACRQGAMWREHFPNCPSFGITVNVSARQLACPEFLTIVRDAVQHAQLGPGDLRLEITETALMDNADQTSHVLGELRQAGVKVYVDDFGTGFSSLSYLHQFPVDTLKIDRTFVANLCADSHHAAIVESIIALAKTLGTDVIAEGVETHEQLETLVRLGCQRAQGFLFSKPLPAAKVAELFLAESVTGGPPWARSEPLPAITDVGL